MPAYELLCLKRVDKLLFIVCWAYCFGVPHPNFVGGTLGDGTGGLVENESSVSIPQMESGRNFVSFG